MARSSILHSIFLFPFVCSLPWPSLILFVIVVIFSFFLSYLFLYIYLYFSACTFLTPCRPTPALRPGPLHAAAAARGRRRPADGAPRHGRPGARRATLPSSWLPPLLFPRPCAADPLVFGHGSAGGELSQGCEQGPRGARFRASSRQPGAGKPRGAPRRGALPAREALLVLKVPAVGQ